MSSEQFCSPSTLEQQILKLEKLILVFLLIETTLHSMHSSNRLKMLRELFSSILQILQKQQYSILSKYTMVLVQLHYLVHIPNSSSLQHMLVLVDLQNMELQSRNKYLVMWAKVPSTHLLEAPKVSRENLLRERFFTPRLVLHRSESRATLSTPQEHYYQQEQQQKPDMFPSTPLLEQSLFLENSLIQRFDTFPQLQLVDYRQYLEARNSCERYRTICIWSFLQYWIWRRSIRKKYLCRYRKYEYYRRRFNYKRSIQNSTHIYHHRLIILNKSEENSHLSRITL